jgi:hypothetical protein
LTSKRFSWWRLSYSLGRSITKLERPQVSTPVFLELDQHRAATLVDPAVAILNHCADQSRLVSEVVADNAGQP